MCARMTKAKSYGSFLGDEFVRRLNYGAQRVAHDAGKFTVDVVNAPQLVVGLQSRARLHGDSSPHGEFAKMYRLHKMRAKSV